MVLLMLIFGGGAIAWLAAMVPQNFKKLFYIIAPFGLWLRLKRLRLVFFFFLLAPLASRQILSDWGPKVGWNWRKHLWYVSLDPHQTDVRDLLPSLYLLIMPGPMTANTVPNQDDIAIKLIVFFVFLIIQ